MARTMFLTGNSSRRSTSCSSSLIALSANSKYSEIASNSSSVNSYTEASYVPA